MIGVVAHASERDAVEEFFELFKTPWEPFERGHAYDVVISTIPEVPEVDARLLVVCGSRTSSIDSRYEITAGRKIQAALVEHGGGTLPTSGQVLVLEAPSGVKCVSASAGSVGVTFRSGNRHVVRLGYDFFQEIRHLLSIGQVVENPRVPSVDVHIEMLRGWMIEAGIAFAEIPPIPAGYPFAVCLTHDVDFIGIRQHKLDHTMWGFLYRATVGTLRNYWRRRIALRHVLQSLQSVVSLPLVHLGLARDFWLPFEWYLRIEKNLPSTYFLIPFKRRAGEKVATAHPQRRACAYDIDDIREWSSRLLKEGCEIGVHGIDAWHNVELGRQELARIQAVTADSNVGIRMHWLLHDDDTCRVLEAAGYSYDSTAGYNETPGYRNGTSQVFRPFGCQKLLELPMHIQDGAMFFPQRMNLPDSAAWSLCESFISNAIRFGGVLTLLWHDRSHAPERFWGEFYVRLVQRLQSFNPWFGTASQVVEWFRKRREVKFRRDETTPGVWIERDRPSGRTVPPLTIRVFPTAGSIAKDGRPLPKFFDRPWSGQGSLELDGLFRSVPGAVSRLPSAA